MGGGYRDGEGPLCMADALCHNKYMDRKVLCLLFLLHGSLCLAAGTPAPDAARAYFIAPQDGAVVQNPVRVVMGLKGMGVAPAGVKSKNTGHFHLLIDTPLPALDRPIPADQTHLHFGGGQTETELTLAPGRHVLQILMGDFAHIPHQPPVYSAPIHITVQASDSP